MSCVQKDFSSFRFCGGMGIFDKEEPPNENALLIHLYEKIPRAALEKRQKENGEGILDGGKQRDS